MHTLNKHFVFAVVLWAEFTDSECNSEKWLGHHSEAQMSRRGGRRGILRTAELPQILFPQHSASPHWEELLFLLFPIAAMTQPSPVSARTVPNTLLSALAVMSPLLMSYWGHRGMVAP